MKCLLCGRRKGKRFCPAKNALICPQCCAEKRVIEVACPRDCTYLRSGISYQSERKLNEQFGSDGDVHLKMRVLETIQELNWAVFLLEEEVVRFSLELRSLRDEQILEGVQLLQKTYATEQKGVIYEHQSPDPIVQSLSRQIHKLLEGFRQPSEERPSLRTGEILRCLEAVEFDVTYHLGQSEKASYLRFITQQHPELGSEERSTSSLIVPGKE